MAPLHHLGMAGLLVLASSMIVPAAAGASAPARLWQLPESGFAYEGSGAGELAGPTGIAVSPFNGDIYVADSSNARIDELDAWGQFVRAFGWGVVASGPDNRPQNEIQEVTVDATGGTFELHFTKSFLLIGDQSSYTESTAPVDADASAGAVEGALEGLEALAPGDVSVTGPAGGPWRIEFTGRYADADIAQLEGSSVSLSGGTASVSVDTVQGGASYEICEPARGDVCRAGQEGGYAPGEIAKPEGLTVDPQGDVYVYEAGDQFLEKSVRVEKFSAEGHFELMLGGRVNQTTGADLCTATEVDEGDECGPGMPGTEAGEFTATNAPAIAVAKDGTLYVGDEGRVQEFNSQGVYEGQLDLPGEASAATEALAVDGEGDLYFDFAQQYGLERAESPGIYKRAGSGWSLFSSMTVPMALAAGPSGDLYVAGRTIRESDHNWRDPSIFQLDSTGRQLVPDSSEEEARVEAERRSEAFAMFGEGFQEPDRSAHASIGGLAAGDPCGAAGEDIYATYVSRSYYEVVAYGPHPDPNVCPPPPRAPSIADQYASAVSSESATVRAKVDSHFWPDATYEVEYGTQPCSLGGCAVAGAGSPLHSESNVAVVTGGVALAGLTPASTYYFRFVAESGGGGPVLGVGGEVGSDGSEGAFTTPPAPAPYKIDCPNQAYRTGAGAALSDCRAYEMVSPVDKEGGNIVTLGDIVSYPAGLDQSSVSGDRLTYSAYGSFGDAASAPYTSQYLASRIEGVGWSSTGISPMRGRDLLGPGELDTEYRAFSPDLCEGWLRLDFETEPALDSAAVEGLPNIYRTNLCEGGGYEALTTAAPSSASALEYESLELEGVAGEGSKAIFLARGNLTSDTAGLPEGTQRLYYTGAGELDYVCILPDGTPVAGQCTAGAYELSSAGGQGELGRRNDLIGAISEDGTHVFFSADGKLYVRENPQQPQSAISKGRCTELELACTLAVSESVSAEAAHFWMASGDGSRVIFSMADGDLYEYSVVKRKATLIAEDVLGVMGASADAARVYFVSTAVLAGFASEGAPNLYLYESGGAPTAFVATLSSSDVNGRDVAALTPWPIARAARVTPDGLSATFMSNDRALSERVAGYDNVDQVTGEPDEEVYLYDASTDRLLCVSCNPSGARPVGENIGRVTTVMAAAQIPTWESDLYASRVLSDDGSRLFFESFEGLVLRDTNERQDVYEWEAASGAATCEEDGAGRYVSAAGGCISLISSGESPEDSSFVDASPSGDDVFFTTGASLVPQDPGLIDVYDARVGGGFPAPATPGICEGEACQAPALPPSFTTPGSLTFNGAGNESHPSGNAKGKGVKSKGKAKKKRAGKRKAKKKAKAKRSGRRRVKARRSGRRRAKGKPARDAARPRRRGLSITGSR